MKHLVAFISLLALCAVAGAVERPEKEFWIFQFPADQIPRIDGDASEWEMVPDSYAIGMDELMDTERGHGTDLDPEEFDLSIKVGWVKGMNRLYFLYEGEDDYWDFSSRGLNQDIFELVVDADMSGGPFIKHRNPNKEVVPVEELHFRTHGVHAQNYHIFTPPLDKEWAMIWGGQPWIKDLPWANAAYDFDFKPGEAGKLTLEFWITPFDYAPHEGPAKAVVSELVEDTLIGMSWVVIDYDDREEQFQLFMNLSHETDMIHDADHLVAFRLMPLTSSLQPKLEADWSYTEVDLERRVIAFKDATVGEVTSWRWDFGDGESSTEQHPVHQYDEAGEWVVTLEVEGPQGTDRHTRVWDVVTP